jgi:hypothetical protein
MSEREIRKIIRSVCADLDQRAKRAAQNTARCVVLPTIMGLSLTVAGCDDKKPGHIDAQASEDGAVIVPDGATEGGAGRDSGVVALYAAPLDAGLLADSGAKDAGQTEDAAIKDAGPQVKYMAVIPDAEADADSGTKRDAGMIALYAVPFIDSGAQAEYAAPMADSGPVLRYMAPDPKQ